MANGEGFSVPAGTVVLETAIDMEQLEKQLTRDVPKRAEKAGADAGAAFGAGFDSGMGDGARKAAEGVKTAGDEARKAGEGFSEAESRMDHLDDTADEVAQTTAGLALVFGRRLVGGLKGAVGWIGRTSAGLLSLSGVGIKQVGTGLRELGEELREVGGAWSAFGVAAQGAGTALEVTGDVMLKVSSAITGLHVAAVAAAGALALAAKRAADDFTPSWNRVLTLIPDAAEGLEELRRRAGSLGAELGLTAEITNRTFYNVLSAMPELVEEPAKALEILRVALEATATGFADGETAAKAITGVLNAFELEADEARRVSDKLFAAQQQGVLTFQDIASEIGKVSGITNALEGDFEDLLAIVATATAELNMPVSETFTQLRGVIRSIVDPSKEAAEAARGMAEGFELSAALLRERGLVGAIQRIIEVTEGRPEMITQVIPEANAQTLIIGLSGALDSLEGRLNNINSTGGLTKDTTDEMNRSWERQKEILDEQVTEALRRVGFRFEGFGVTALGVVNDILGKMNELDAKMRDLDFTEFIGFDDFAEGLREFLEMLDDPPVQVEITTRRTPPVSLSPSGEPVGGFQMQLGPRPGEPIERPARPVSPEISRSRIQAQQARMELAAFIELMETGDLEQYETALEAIQLRINDLVGAEAERLQQMGVEADRIQTLLSLYDSQVEKLLQIEAEAPDFEEMLKPELLRRFERLMELGAEMEGFEAGPGGMLQPAGRPDAQTAALRELAEFSLELERSSLSAEERLDALGEKMNELGITGEELREGTSALAAEIRERLLRVLPQWAVEMLNIAEGTEEADEATSDLLDDVRDLAQLAGGVLSLASAFGVFGDEAEQALQRGVTSAVQLVQGINSLQEAIAEGASGLALLGPIGAVAGGAAGLVGPFVREVFGPSASELRGDARREAVRENTAALERLRTNLDKLVAAISDLPGDVIAAARELTEGIDLTQLVPRGGELLEGGITEAEDQFLDMAFDVNLASGAAKSFFQDSFIAQLEAMGLTVTDLESIAQATGMSIENLSAILRGDFAEGSIPAAIDELEKLQLAAKELELERLTETFSGAFDMLRREFELFDEAFDGPIDKLRRMRELFLEFVDLPAGMEAALGDADLSTPEGRKAFEETLQRVFEGIQSGEITAEDLGGLTPSEFLDMLVRMEGLVDDAAQEAGDGSAGGFQVSRQITEITGSRIAAVLTTLSFQADTRNRILSAILTQLGGSAPQIPATGIQPPPQGAVQGGDGSSVSYHFDDVIGGDLFVEVTGVEGDPSVIGRDIGRSVLLKIDEGLQDLRRDEGRRGGQV